MMFQSECFSLFAFLDVSLPVLLGETADKPNALKFDVDLAVYTLIIFGLLLVVLTKFAWRPIMDGLELREKSIEDKIASAARAEEEAKASLQQYEAKLAGAHDEAAAVMAEAKSDAATAKERIMTQANEEANRTRERAMADIEVAKNNAVRELAESSADTAVNLAGSIVGRTLQKEDHSQLIQNAVNDFGS